MHFILLNSEVLHDNKILVIKQLICRQKIFKKNIILSNLEHIVRKQNIFSESFFFSLSKWFSTSVSQDSMVS